MPRIEWDTSLVRSVETVVRVDDVVRAHESVTWGQDLASSLPAQVSAAGQFGQRTGTIVWHRPGVSTYLPSPWSDKGGWVPSIGQSVTVDAVDGKGNTVRVFTGRIDTVEGDASGGMVSKIVDRSDDFNRTVRVEALTEIGAPWKDDGSKRYTAPSCAWVVDDILRQCGYYSTPPAPSGLILDAPLQGTVYLYAEPPAHRNAQLGESGGYTGQAPNPQFWGGGVETGLALRDARLEYLPYSGGGSGAERLRVSLVVHPNHRDQASVEVVKSNGGTATLWVDGDKRVRVGTNPHDGHATTHTAFTIPQDLDVITVSAIFRGGTIDVASSFGQSATITARTPVGPVSRINVLADYQAAIAGVQVSDPGASGGHLATAWKPSAVIRYGWHAWKQRVAPSIRDENAKDVLSEFAEAMLAPVHIDGNGVVQVAGSDTLYSQAAVVGVDVLSTVADMSWSLSLMDHRERVEVEWDEVNVSMNTQSTHASILLWQGSGQTVNQWDQIEEPIEVPADEEWISLVRPEKIHLSSNLTDPGWVADFNAGRKSFYGGTPDGEAWGTSGDLTESYDQLSPWAWRRRAAAAHDLTLKAPEVSWISKRLWGMEMPVIRGKGRVKRQKSTYVRSPQSESPRTLVHKMGRWCTQSAIAKAFGDWLFNQVYTPRAVVNGLVIRFDPRVDVGTVIQIDSLQMHGVAVEGLVISADHNPSADTSSLTIRVIKTKTSLGSYGDLAIAWNGASYGTVQAAWATIAGTYEAVETDPLWKGYNK